MASVTRQSGRDGVLVSSSPWNHAVYRMRPVFLMSRPAGVVEVVPGKDGGAGDRRLAGAVGSNGEGQRRPPDRSR